MRMGIYESVTASLSSLSVVSGAWGLGFRVLRLGFRVRVLGFRVLSLDSHLQ